MNGKDRLQVALNHNFSDRMPLAYEAEWEVTQKLVEYFGLDKREDLEISQVSSFHSPIGERATIGIEHELELQRLLGVDLSKVACPG